MDIWVDPERKVSKTMDYIHEEADTDNSIDELSAELKRAEAAAVMACQNVSKSLESVEDAKRVQPEEPSATA